MNVKTWIPLVMAVALGLVAMVVARKALRPSKPAEAPSNTSPVVVAKHDVPVGRELSAADLVVARVPKELTPGQSFRTADELVGRTVTTQIVKGQTVVDTLLAPTGSGAGVTALVEPGQRAITIEVNEFSGLAGMLVPGSRVDVICTARDEKIQQQVSKTILQNIRVLATGRQLSAAVPEGQPAPPPSNNVTLLVTPKQAQALQLASQGGRPWLVLRSLRDGRETPTEATTMADIRGDGADAPATRPATAVADAGDPFGHPATQPAAPPAPKVWVMKVIRGGVATEVSFPVDAATDARPFNPVEVAPAVPAPAAPTAPVAPVVPETLAVAPVVPQPTTAPAVVVAEPLNKDDVVVTTTPPAPIATPTTQPSDLPATPVAPIAPFTPMGPAQAEVPLGPAARLPEEEPVDPVTEPDAIPEPSPVAEVAVEPAVAEPIPAPVAPPEDRPTVTGLDGN